MQKLHRASGLMPCAGFLYLLASALYAADTPNSSNNEVLQEVVVTATKRAENLQEVPGAVTAITSDTLEQLGISQFSDYLALVPSLSQNNTGGPGHGLVVLRGLSTGSQQTASTVSYIIDDIPFTSNSSIAIGSLLTPDPDLTDIERIEVLAGPQGTLYGATALGGIIKIVSKKPDINAVAGDVRVDGDTVAGGASGYGVRGDLNLPLASMMALRISAFDRTDPGFIKNVKTGATDTNKVEVSGGKVALRIAPTADLDIELTGLLQDLKDYDAALVDTEQLTLQPAYCNFCYSSPILGGFNTQYRLGGLVVNWTTPAGTLTNSLSYGKYKDAETFDYTREYGIYNTSFFGLPPSTVALGRLYPNMRKTTEELRFATNRFGSFEGLGGLFYTDEHDEYNATITNLSYPALTELAAPFGNFVGSFTPSTYKEYAAFVDLTYYFIPQVDLTFGGRYSHDKQTANSSSTGLLAQAPNNFASSESKATYLATLRYRPTAQVDTYARVATGYRPGGPQLAVVAGVPPAFRPDTTINYELGVKARWLDNRLETNLAIYDIKWNDIQLNRLVGGFQVEDNAGKATSKGIELQSSYRPFASLLLSLTASYDKATIDEDFAPVGAIAGDPLPYAPKVTGALSGDYSVPFNSDWKGTAGFTVAYQGGRSTSWSKDPLNLDVRLPSYTTLAMRVGAEWRNYTLQLRAENLTNKFAFQTSEAPNIFPAQGVLNQSVPITPRMWYLTLSAKF